MKNMKPEKNSGFETKTDFKEDNKIELSDDEECEEEDEDSNIE